MKQLISQEIIENNSGSRQLKLNNNLRFELKVLKGAKEMMIQNNIQFIHIELFFDLNFIVVSINND